MKGYFDNININIVFIVGVGVKGTEEDRGGENDIWFGKKSPFYTINLMRKIIEFLGIFFLEGIFWVFFFILRIYFKCGGLVGEKG